MLAMLSCGQKNSAAGYETAESGVRYKFYHQNQEGVKPVVGDFLKIQMVYTLGDSVIFDTRKENKAFEMKLENPVFEGDVYAAVAMMKEGDSAGFLINASQFFTKLVGQNPQDLEGLIGDDEDLVFNLKLVDVSSAEDHEQEVAQRLERLKNGEPALVEKYLKANNIPNKPLESGLFFLSTRKGKGAKPRKGDMVTVNFKVMLMDGTVLFDSWERGEPVSFEFGKQFDTQGLVEGVSLMKEGEKAHLVVPSKLAFGQYGRPGLVDPYSPILYDVELLEVKDAEEMKREAIREMAKNEKESQAFLSQNATREGVVVLPSGLQYKVLKSGDGKKSPSASSRVKVHYTGTLIDGTTFDSSVERGRPSEFNVGGVIKGWTEALQIMKEGDKWQLFIPADLAYGAKGAGKLIKPNMALIFEVELLEIVE